MSYEIPQDRDSKFHLNWLMKCLKDNNMSGARAAILELLDIGYEGNHEKELEPYKHQLIHMVLSFIKNEAWHLADALTWQLTEMGLNWVELKTIRASTQKMINRS